MPGSVNVHENLCEQWPVSFSLAAAEFARIWSPTRSRLLEVGPDIRHSKSAGLRSRAPDAAAPTSVLYTVYNK